MRSFLKWAGGKGSIIDKIRQVLPKKQRLVEPFVGSGTVFLNMDFKENLAADINADLINTFKLIQEDELFIDYCKGFFFGNNTKDKYYKFRNIFNSTNDIRLKSALFVYLNRHCFNGLCRYNSTGGFNVPFGQYKNPYFPENEMYNIKIKNVTFMCTDFRDLWKLIQKDDIVYCDPPYIPISKTSNFTNYSGKFEIKDHEDLAKLAHGYNVIISNSDTEESRRIFKDANKIIQLTSKRNISGKSSSRGQINELMFIYET
jgi:DNA adenine methylase